MAISKKGNMMKIKVALLFGGKSAEHDISVISALQAYRHLNKDKYDVFPFTSPRTARCSTARTQATSRRTPR